MASTLFVAILAGATLQVALGHSWIACTDYAEKNAAYYDHSKCRGYARSGKRYAPRGGTFGQDMGFDYHPSETKPCRDTRSDNTEYDANHPVAVYYPGQQVVLAHPMKNHGSDVCTNPFIPDNGNFIYRGTRNAQSDPTLSQFRKNLVADLGIKDMSKPYDVYPKPGYQNAPAFCENTDKSLGTYSFNIPTNLQSGRYTFIWLWGFNSAQDLYSTCFEVDIVATMAERNSRLLSNGISNLYEPCGGMTSKAGIMGNSNPGCTDIGASTTSSAASTASSTTSTAATTTKTTTPSTAAPGQNPVPVLAEQFSGYLSLPAADFSVKRRIVKTHWGCPVTVHYWGAVVVDKQDLPSGGVEYELLQEGFDLVGAKIYFHASFVNPCDTKSYPPQATLISEEK